MSGSAFSLTISVPASSFEVIAGDPVIGGVKGPEIHHYHCDHCKSWVFTRIEGIDFFLNVRASLLDDPSWVVPYIETCTAEKLPWAGQAVVSRSYEKFPDAEEYASLSAAYHATL